MLSEAERKALLSSSLLFPLCSLAPLPPFCNSSLLPPCLSLFRPRCQSGQRREEEEEGQLRFCWKIEKGRQRQRLDTTAHYRDQRGKDREGKKRPDLARWSRGDG